MARYLYSELASAVQARLNCERSGNTEWLEKWGDRIRDIEREYLPSGSGFDSGTRVNTDDSHAEKLVLHTSFHHMNDAGMYDGWTEHVVTVTPSFNGINIRVGGRNRNDIKDHIHQTFYDALTSQEDQAAS